MIYWTRKLHVGYCLIHTIMCVFYSLGIITSYVDVIVKNPGGSFQGPIYLYQIIKRYFGKINLTLPSPHLTSTVILELELELELEKSLLDKKQIQTGNNVINHTYRVLYVGRPLQRRWAHRWRKSHPNILQCMNRHCAHEVLTFWEHEFGICNQNESTPLGKAPSRHTRGTQLT